MCGESGQNSHKELLPCAGDVEPLKGVQLRMKFTFEMVRDPMIVSFGQNIDPWGCDLKFVWVELRSMRILIHSSSHPKHTSIDDNDDND